jgi:hypothetical protein
MKKYLTLSFAALLCAQVAAAASPDGRSRSRSPRARKQTDSSPRPNSSGPPRGASPTRPTSTPTAYRSRPTRASSSMMAALDAAGWDPTPEGASPSVFREAVRRDLAALDPALRARMRDFYDALRLQGRSGRPEDARERGRPLHARRSGRALRLARVHARPAARLRRAAALRGPALGRARRARLRPAPARVLQAVGHGRALEHIHAARTAPRANACASPRSTWRAPCSRTLTRAPRPRSSSASRWTVVGVEEEEREAVDRLARARPTIPNRARPPCRARRDKLPRDGRRLLRNRPRRH